MSEQLLKGPEVAEAMRISRRTFFRLRPKFHADGLLPVRIGAKAVRYRRSDLERVIKRSAEQGRALGV